MSIRRLLAVLIGICLLLLLLSACNNPSPITAPTLPVVVGTSTQVNTPAPSITPIPPTETPVPLAVLVNGEGISMPEYQQEVVRFQASTGITGTNIATDTQTIVLDDLIDQMLLAQAASENGYVVDNSLLQTRIDALSSQLGGTQALQTWQAAHGYNDDSFRTTLKRSISAAWMRDQIIAAVPETADQVHVMQILLPTQVEADQVYASLQSGKDFLDVAYTYDTQTGGDLGWFPQGYLSDPRIEDTAFGLQPGQYSAVIQTDLGFHILYLVERDPAHPLSPVARQALQVKAVQNWLSDRRAHSQIQILLPKP